MDRETIRLLLLDTLRHASPWFVRAAVITVIVWIGLMMARAGFDGLALAALSGGLVVAFLCLTRAVHEFLVASGGGGRVYLLAAASWPRCYFTSFYTRALRVAAPPPRFTPAI